MSGSEYGDWIMTQMPENFRQGSVFTKPEDSQIYPKVYVGAIVAFFIINFILRLMFTYCCKKELFNAKNKVQKQRYLEKWTSNVHHVIIVCLTSFNFMYQTCEEGEGQNFFNNDVCFMQVDPKFVMAEMVYVGYLTQNYIELKF